MIVRKIAISRGRVAQGYVLLASRRPVVRRPASRAARLPSPASPRMSETIPVRLTLVHTTSDSEAAAVERVLTGAGIDYDMRLEPKLDTNGPCLLGLLFDVEEKD